MALWDNISFYIGPSPRDREKGEKKKRRVKMSKPPPPPSAPSASTIGPCSTTIQIVGRPGTGSLPRTIAPPDHSLWPGGRSLPKMGSTLIDKNLLRWEQILYEITPIYMRGNNENKRVSSTESIPIYLRHKNTVQLQWFEHWWLVCHGCFELVFESVGKNHTAADIIIFGIIEADFLFYIDNGMLCVLTKNRLDKAILMRTHNIRSY